MHASGDDYVSKRKINIGREGYNTKHCDCSSVLCNLLAFSLQLSLLLYGPLSNPTGIMSLAEMGRRASATLVQIRMLANCGMVRTPRDWALPELNHKDRLLGNRGSRAIGNFGATTIFWFPQTTGANDEVVHVFIRRAYSQDPASWLLGRSRLHVTGHRSAHYRHHQVLKSSHWGQHGWPMA